MDHFILQADILMPMYLLLQSPITTYLFESTIHEHDISFLIRDTGKRMLDKEHLAFTLTLHDIDEPLGIVFGPVNPYARVSYF